MRHYAELKDGKVLRVIVVNDKDAPTEKQGIEFCKNLLGGEWVETDYDGKSRKQYAGIGYSYDSEKNVFISQKPYPSWTSDEKSDWKAPKEKPKDDKMYSWNEEKLEWEKEKDVRDTR